jgi:hypothetical protein
MQSIDDIFANVADQDRGRALELIDPFTGDPVGIRLTVAGPDSNVARRARLHFADELAEMADASGRVSAEHRVAARLISLASLVLTWDAQVEGKPVPFSTAAIRKLLGVAWVEAQVDGFAGDRRHFAPEVA